MEKKYKQTVIPSVKIIQKKNLSAYIRKEYSENVQGKTVVNKHIGLTIFFGKSYNDVTFAIDVVP